jgi:hypothetical protein
MSYDSSLESIIARLDGCMLHAPGKQKSPGLAIAYKWLNFTKSPKSAKQEFGSC